MSDQLLGFDQVLSEIVTFVRLNLHLNSSLYDLRGLKFEHSASTHGFYNHFPQRGHSL